MSHKVTGNAQLFLGYLTHVLMRDEPDWPYRPVGADPAAATIDVENRHTGTSFRVSVVQIGGDE